MRSYSPRPGVLGIDTTRPAGERYRIVGRIACGGMAEIYLARMLTRNNDWKEVIIKRLLPELQTEQDFIDMFYDEARIASQMHHPNIVEIFELGELEGSLFISMELLEGVNLHELSSCLVASGTPAPIFIVLSIARGALDALTYAHNFKDASGRLLHLVHRDVSPQNIAITYDGRVKLLDFGVAKADGRLHRTKSGLIKGKFSYMSPEQVFGGQVDGRSDLFALGEVLFLLLLNRHPFEGGSETALLRLALDGESLRPPSFDPTIPPPLEAVLSRALERDASDRYPDARSMKSAVDELAASWPAPAELLGGFVRGMFEDRLRIRDKARTMDDDLMLLRSMRVGAKGSFEGTPAWVDGTPEGEEANDFHEASTLSPGQNHVPADVPVPMSDPSVMSFDGEFSTEPTLIEYDGRDRVDQDVRVTRSVPATVPSPPIAVDPDEELTDTTLTDQDPSNASESPSASVETLPRRPHRK